MDPNTITAATFTLKTTSGGVPVAGTVSYDGPTKTATFTPNAPLSNNTSYTATVTTGAKSAASVPLAADKVWAFTTNTPTITATTPTNGATGIPVGTTVKVTFSENMDANTLTTLSGNFTLKVTATSAAVAGTVSYNSATREATFTPTAPKPIAQYDFKDQNTVALNVRVQRNF